MQRFLRYRQLIQGRIPILEETNTAIELAANCILTKRGDYIKRFHWAVTRAEISYASHRLVHGLSEWMANAGPLSM